MKWLIFFIIPLFSCGWEFPTGYETIENDKIRSIAVVYDNNQLAEGSPSDTVDLYAYFGGEKVSSVNWSFLAGSGTDILTQDTVPLENIMVPGSYKEHTGQIGDSVILSIVISSSFLRDRLAAVDNVGALVPSFLKSSFSPALLQRNPLEVLDVLEFLASQPSSGDQVVDSLVHLLTGDNTTDVKEFLPRILQIFSVQLNVLVIVNEKYKARSNITIRYNSKLRYLGKYIPVNRNPQIERICLYRVRGERETFDPQKNASFLDTSYDLMDLDSITYKRGCSYFLQVFRKGGLIDSSVSLQGILDEEHYTCEWFMQDNSNQGSGSGLMRLVGDMSLSSIVKIKMPANPVNRSFTVWCVVYDFLLGERLRPVGFAIRRTRGVVVAP